MRGAEVNAQAERDLEQVKESTDTNKNNKISTLKQRKLVNKSPNQEY